MSFFPRLPRQFFSLPIFNTQMILEVSFSALQTSKGPRCPSVHGKEGIRGLLIIETGHWLWNASVQYLQRIITTLRVMYIMDP